MATARGKYSKAISDRSGFAFPYSEMIEEHDGVFVHKSEFEPEHPQEDNPSTHRADAEALKNARPNTDVETSGFVVYTNIGDGILVKLLTSDLEATTALGTVTVTTS